MLFLFHFTHILQYLANFRVYNIVMYTTLCSTLVNWGRRACGCFNFGLYILNKIVYKSLDSVLICSFSLWLNCVVFNKDKDKQQRLYCKKYEALKYKFLLDVDLFTTLMGQ